MPLNSKGLGLLGVLSAIGIAAVIAVPYIGTTIPAANADTGSTSSDTVAFKPGFDKTPDEALCKDDHYINASTLTVKVGDAAYRQFATAVSIPFKGTTDDEVNKEIISEVCGNPTVLKMVIDDMMLWTGFPGAEENKEWISKIQTDMTTQGLDAFSGTNEAGDKVVSPEFQKYAGWVNTVLLRFKMDGNQSLTSVRNWELPATVDPSTQPVAVLAADQESKPSWVRTLLDKNGKCLYKIGFNAEDKRIETFNCVEPTPPATVTPPPVTTPGCKTDCGGTPPCTTHCGPPPCTGTSCNPCPPGNTIPDCAPKSHNPGDYTYPTGKPPVTVTTPPEATPPAVNTTQPGGGGVIDTPANNPGTETGTTAPGATPAPTTPATPPANQGGDNGAGDTGGF